MANTDTDIDHAKTAKFWDKNARKYAASKISDQAEYENGLEITKTFLNPQQQVLEMGCGTGTTALILAPFVAHLTATDISPEMIAIGNEKKTAAGIENLAFKVAATTAPGSSTGQFDAVLAFSLLHLVDSLTETLEQINRELTPGGLFISKTPCLNENFLFSLLRWPLVLAEKIGLAPEVTFFTANQLDRKIESAGFELVHGYITEKAPRRRYVVARKKA